MALWGISTNAETVANNYAIPKFQLETDRNTSPWNTFADVRGWIQRRYKTRENSGISTRYFDEVLVDVTGLNANLLVLELLVQLQSSLKTPTRHHQFLLVVVQQLVLLQILLVMFTLCLMNLFLRVLGQPLVFVLLMQTAITRQQELLQRQHQILLPNMLGLELLLLTVHQEYIQVSTVKLQTE